MLPVRTLQLKISSEQFTPVAASIYQRLAVIGLLWCLAASSAQVIADSNWIDDRSSETRTSSSGASWRLITDQVMGGVSTGTLQIDQYKGRDCLRLLGAVSTANNGGFIQMALELAGGRTLDASPYQGVVLDIAGNGEPYNLHLRTAGLLWPWQSYRASFLAGPDWSTVRIPFSELEPYRTSLSFNPRRLVRLGLVAIGRDYHADLCLGAARFYRDD